ncbi:MAG: hypothetical protein WBG37_19455 [Desulfobacterales bacterium]
MGEQFDIDLGGIPWPANLLQCHRVTEAMRPGDTLIIRFEDGDLKDSLELILRSLPGHRFETRTLTGGYLIRVVRNRLAASGREKLADDAVQRHLPFSRNI